MKVNYEVTVLLVLQNVSAMTDVRHYLDRSEWLNRGDGSQMSQKAEEEKASLISAPMGIFLFPSNSLSLFLAQRVI